MGYEAIGKVHRIGETQHVSDTFSKREVVLEIADNPKYPQLVSFEVTKDKCGDLDEFNPGDEVRVEFNLRGREWRSPKGETKYFNTLQIWRIEARRQTRTSQTMKSKGAPADAPPLMEDDIPFATADMDHEPSAIAKVLR